MNRHLYHYTIAGILFTAIAGTLLHFAYEYSMENPLVAMFAPVNESTWEHMKLVFLPMNLYLPMAYPAIIVMINTITTEKIVTIMVLIK